MPAVPAPRHPRGSTPGARAVTTADGTEFEKVPGDVQVHKPMSARTKARKRALDVLFESEAKGADPLVILEEHLRGGEPPVREFTVTLVRGVVEHAQSIDDRIRRAAPPEWPIERMAGVDRNLARIAVFEIDHSEVAPEAAIAEAVLLADELSTDESAPFLNGLLAKVAKGD